MEKKLSQKQIILKYLQFVNDWVVGYKLVGINTPYGFIGSEGARICRRLAEKGEIEKKVEKYVYYRSKQIGIKIPNNLQLSYAI